MFRLFHILKDSLSWYSNHPFTKASISIITMICRTSSMSKGITELMILSLGWRRFICRKLVESTLPKLSFHILNPLSLFLFLSISSIPSIISSFFTQIFNWIFLFLEKIQYLSTLLSYICTHGKKIISLFYLLLYLLADSFRI